MANATAEVHPATRTFDVGRVLIYFVLIVGAAAGFAMYATYDLTNLSFVRGYPLLMSAVDIAWGTAQGACAGVYVYHLMRLWS